MSAATKGHYVHGVEGIGVTNVFKQRIFRVATLS